MKCIYELFHPCESNQVKKNTGSFTQAVENRSYFKMVNNFREVFYIFKFTYSFHFEILDLSLQHPNTYFSFSNINLYFSNTCLYSSLYFSPPDFLCIPSFLLFNKKIPCLVPIPIYNIRLNVLEWREYSLVEDMEAPILATYCIINVSSQSRLKKIGSQFYVGC